MLIMVNEAIKKILICLDNNAYSESVAKRGILLAKKMNADISILYPINTNGLSNGSYLPEDAVEAIKTKIRKSARGIISKYNCAASVFIIEGNTIENILEKAIDINAALIVLGVQHRIKSKRTSLQNLAKEVLNRSEIPVLIVSGK